MLAISSAASSRLSSISPSPASVKALERREAASESPEEEITAACLNCSACKAKGGDKENKELLILTSSTITPKGVQWNPS